MCINHCRVCGLYIDTPPWGENYTTPTYEICPCCGVEFGNEDYDYESVIIYRENWINQGANWFLNKEKPQIWNIKKQMMNIPKTFQDKKPNDEYQ